VLKREGKESYANKIRSKVANLGTKGVKRTKGTTSKAPGKIQKDVNGQRQVIRRGKESVTKEGKRQTNSSQRIKKSEHDQ